MTLFYTYFIHALPLAIFEAYIHSSFLQYFTVTRSLKPYG